MSAANWKWAGTCAICGGPTSTGNGKANAALRCIKCFNEHHPRKLAAAKRDEQVAQCYREGLTAWETAERTGIPYSVVRTIASRARKKGLDCPFAPHGTPSHRVR
jgi:DNA-binding CsgD family transcriptional regulator